MSKKPLSSEYKSIPFNLDELKRFHPGLIYGFDAESPRGDYDLRSVEFTFHKMGQMQDIFDAYMYAQETILPSIRDQGIAAISSEQLLNWINQIHLRIANTVALDYKDTAGTYTQQQIFSWHHTTNMQDLVVAILCNLLRKGMDPITEAKKLGADPAVMQKFLDLLTKIRDDKSLTITAKQKQQMTSKYQVGQETLFKLVNLYNNKKLSEGDRDLVDKMLRICPSPEQIPSLMQQFASDLLKKWQTCDPHNLDQLAKLAFFSFAKLTENHPYFNCNGRTATCLMNIVLVSLGQPSILMRYPGERDQENSSYALAIEGINTQPKLMVTHIKSRIKDSTSFSNQELAQIATKRMVVTRILRELKKHLSNEVLNQEYRRILELTNTINEIGKIILKVTNPLAAHLKPQALEIYNTFVAEYGYPLLSAIDKELMFNILTLISIDISLPELNKLKQKFAQPPSQHDANMNSSSSSSASDVVSQIPPVVKHQYSPEEKKSIITKLEALTNQSNWKAYNDKGSTSILLTLTLEQKPLANEIVLALNKTESLRAELKREPSSGKPVIKLSAIEIHKLLAVETLSELNSGAAVEKLTADVENLGLK